MPAFIRLCFKLIMLKLIVFNPGVVIIVLDRYIKPTIPVSDLGSRLNTLIFISFDSVFVVVPVVAERHRYLSDLLAKDALSPAFFCFFLPCG